MIKLIDLEINESGIIEHISDYKLMEHGFIPGTEFTIANKLLGIIVVSIRGTLLAIREIDLENIHAHVV